MKLHVYSDAAGERRWKAIAGNNRNVGNSSEGYDHEQDCLAGFALVRGCSVEDLLSGAAGVEIVYDAD